MTPEQLNNFIEANLWIWFCGFWVRLSIGTDSAYYEGLTRELVARALFWPIFTVIWVLKGLNEALHKELRR